MAQSPAQLSGTDVSKVESDISQTITLADAVVTLIREPIAALLKHKEKREKLRQSLGIWYEEALDMHNQPRTPLLQVNAFEQYLVQCDGAVPAFEPATQLDQQDATYWNKLKWWGHNKTPSHEQDMPNYGKACWAYFLFALGVRPGLGVTGWRPSDGYLRTQDGSIEMEMDGQVMCHIINLYSMTLDPSPHARYYDERLPDRCQEMRCEFAFGELTWTPIGGQNYACFIPGADVDLKSAKTPFGENGEFMLPGTAITSYLTALQHGVSNEQYQLLRPSEPDQERARRLITCFDKLLNRKAENTLLISYDWFEEAARVKRRVLAQGGEDYSFFKDICQAINNESHEIHIKRRMKEKLRRKFLFEKETFHCLVAGSGERSSSPYSPIPPTEEVLLGYENQPSASWKRSLFDMRSEVTALLDMSNNVVLSKAHRIQLIEFTKSCDMWKKKVLLGAPFNSYKDKE